MACLSCGVESPADPDTGYQGDPICPRCAREGWTVLSDGTLVSPEDLDAVRAIVARIERRMLRAQLRSRPARGASIG